MSDYVRQNDFSIKDALPSGSTQKIIKGTDVDAEFDAIVTAIASKLDNISAATTGNVPLIGASGTTLTDSGYSITAVKSPFINAKAYSAMGDDTNDDTAEIQAAFNAGAGYHIRLPAGTYKISSALSPPSNCIISGDGRGTIIKVYANSDAFTISGKSNVTIQDLAIDGQRGTYTTNTNEGIAVDWTTTAGSGVKIRNVYIHDVAGAGIQCLASVGQASSGILVDGCEITDTGSHGICVQDYISDVTITSNKVSNYGLGVSDRCGIVTGRNGSRNVVSNNIVRCSASALGTSAQGISIDLTSDCTVNGNIVTDTIGYGIELAFVENGSFVGNTISGCVRAGIGLSGIEATSKINKNCVISGNTIRNGDAQGIYSTMTGGTGAVLHENIVVSGNSVINNAGAASIGISMGFVKNLNIIGNVVTGSTLSGIYILDCLYWSISGNTVFRNNIDSIKDVTSITLSGSTATVTATSHGFSNSDSIRIFGANPSDYSGTFTIGNVATHTFDYTTTAGLDSPAVGLITAAKGSSASHGGITTVYSAITTKNTGVFGSNYVYENGFRDYYDISYNGYVGDVENRLFLKECGAMRAENLTSGESANVLDRAAIFLRNDHIVIAYNNAGTINYLACALDGATTTWTNSTAI